jgi:predicted metal-binding membrane protein
VSLLERVLRRERALIAIGIACITALAWSYLWRGAGMGMSALQMTSVALFPHTQPEPMPGMQMPAVPPLTVVAMWMTMMTAMMTPSAAPLLLLYGRVTRHTQAQNSSSVAIVSPFFIVIGYLSVWFGFSILASWLQYVLQHAQLISTMMLWSQSAVLSATVLIAAGIYQLSPLKQVCLRHCRGPVDFLVRHWRPGRLGALSLGVLHGMWCLGCCWVLMALLFVGGVMNLIWIALLALLVLSEKLAPRGFIVSRISGGLLIVWGIVTLAVE